MAFFKLLELPYLFDQESPTFALQVVTFLQPTILVDPNEIPLDDEFDKED